MEFRHDESLPSVHSEEVDDRTYLSLVRPEALDKVPFLSVPGVVPRSRRFGPDPGPRTRMVCQGGEGVGRRGIDSETVGVWAGGEVRSQGSVQTKEGGGPDDRGFPVPTRETEGRVVRTRGYVLLT